jgi:hypothetical protein
VKRIVKDITGFRVGQQVKITYELNSMVFYGEITEINDKEIFVSYGISFGIACTSFDLDGTCKTGAGLTTITPHEITIRQAVEEIMIKPFCWIKNKQVFCTLIMYGEKPKPVILRSDGHYLMPYDQFKIENTLEKREAYQFESIEELFASMPFLEARANGAKYDANS